MDGYYQNSYYSVTDAGENTMDEYHQNQQYSVTDAGEDTMDEYYDNTYYPIADLQQYPSFPPENAEASAGPNQDIDLQLQIRQLHLQNEELQTDNEKIQSQYNQLQIQHNDLQDKQSNLQDQHDALQSRHTRLCLHIRDDPIAHERLFVSARKLNRANLVEHNNELEAPVENVVPVGGHRYITRSTQKTQPAVMGEPFEDDDSNLTSDLEYAASEGCSDEEMDDEDYEPTPKSVAPATPAVASPETRPFARQAAVAHHEEFAYCRVSITKEEFSYVRGKTYGAPHTLPKPDKNGNIQDHKRMRITWAEREELNAWRVRNGRKPHEIREGTKDAAARDSWRLSFPSRHRAT